MNILVTGGHGFLGRHVVPELKRRGHVVDTPRRSEWDLESGGDYHLFRHADCVVHLAALCGGIGANMRQPAEFWDVNLWMGMNVIRRCVAAKKKLVLLGTTCSYPKLALTPFKEESLFKGYPEETNAPYGIAKLALGVGLAAYEKQYGLKCAYLIPTNLYGEHDHFEPERSHVIPAMIRKFHTAKQLGEETVTLWGDGTPTRDFLYAGDCAKAVALACERETNSDPINLGSGVEIPMETLAFTIAGEIGFNGGLVWDKTKPNGQPRRLLDTSRARERLGWQSTTHLVEGIRNTVKWYRENEVHA